MHELCTELTHTATRTPFQERDVGVGEFDHDVGLGISENVTAMTPHMRSI